MIITINFKILSCELSFLSAFIQSGLLWRFIEFTFFYEESFEFGGGFNFERIQKINNFSEDSALILRNASIFSLEAFILKNASSSSASNEKSSWINLKSRSEAVFKEIYKLEKNKKEILICFFENIEVLLGYRVLSYITEDYSEPKVMPEEKDRRAIKKLLRAVNGNCEEEDFVWNEDVRCDLMDLVRRQISFINDEKGYD